MKTTTTLKTTASLFTAAVLLALPGHAAQNFYKTHTSKTGDNNFGLTGTLYAYDNYLLARGTKLGSYSVTAGGALTGKVLGKSLAVASGKGTVKVLSNGAGSFTGNLKAVGKTLFNVSNTGVPYQSQHYIKEWEASKSYPFSIAFIPFNVKGKVKASIDAYFRVDTQYTEIPGGAVPQIDVKIGPVVDVAASAEASVGAGIDGFASLSAGATGNLRVGKVALTANALLFPTFPELSAGGVATGGVIAATAPAARIKTSHLPGVIALSPVLKKGASVKVALTASTTGINGHIDLWAEAELWPFGSDRVSKTIASYSSGPLSTNLLGPVTYKWF